MLPPLNSPFSMIAHNRRKPREVARTRHEIEGVSMTDHKRRAKRNPVGYLLTAAFIVGVGWLVLDSFGYPFSSAPVDQVTTGAVD